MMIRTYTRLTAILVSLLMVFAMTPLSGTQSSYADDSTADSGDKHVAAGGIVASNSAENALAAFSSGGVQSADAVYDVGSKTMTITLNNDIDLTAPVKFIKGERDDQVVLDLNGHTITARAGRSGMDEAAAKGGNAIEIVAEDYNVEIKGPGAVAGGKGAVFETEDHLKRGMDGGMAVCFARSEDGSYWCANSENDNLIYGFRLKGGAVITGGAGADISGDDWIYGIEKYSGGDRYSNYGCPQFRLRAGNGGAGLGQVDTGIPNEATTVSYARIDVIGGTIKGGSGGKLDLGSPDTPVLTHYSLMNSDAISAYMDEKNWKNTSNYDDYVSRNISFKAGNGGDGILIGAGRKYVKIGLEAEVQGGECGEIDYGQSKTLNCIRNDRADAGNGIMVYGDVGLTYQKVNEKNWATDDYEHNDTGIYIEGSVKGGRTSNVYAMHEDSGNAGDGIALNGEEKYISSGVDVYGNNELLPLPGDNDYKYWGVIIVARRGKVGGGDAGSALYGGAGSGGDGISETYTKGDDQTYDSDIGTDHYLVNGEIYGGRGGTEFNARTGDGVGGGPGNGIFFGNYRKHAHIAGNGTVSGGDWGSGAGEVEPDLTLAQGIRFYPEDRDYYENTVSDSLEENTGNSPAILNVKNDGLSVSASMTSFKDYPAPSTKLSCKVKKPSGYNGSVYIQWFATLKLQINTPEVGTLEPSGTNSASFNLLSNDQYKYLAYPTYGDRPDLGNSYNEEIVTVDRINETIEHKDSYAEIECYVFLEDGRWAKSNTIHFTKEGWTDTSGGTGGDNPSGSDDVNPSGTGGDNPSGSDGKDSSVSGNDVKNQKAVNSLRVKGRKVQIKVRKLKKKSQTLKASKVIRFVKKGQGKRTYKLAGVNKKKYKKYFKVNKKNGKLTVKKRLKKGTYKVRIKVTASGDKTHYKASKTVTCKIKVK